MSQIDNDEDFITSKIQGDFLMCDATEVLFQGGRGAGKSTAMILSFLMEIGKGYGPAWSGLLITNRSSGLMQLEQTCARLCANFCPEVDHVQRIFRFPHGEKLQLIHTHDNEEYRTKVHGSGACFLGFDELTLWSTSEVYLSCLTSLRNADKPGGRVVPLKLRSTTNPMPSINGGRSWVYDRFIKGKKSGVVYNESGMTIANFFATIKDNKALLRSTPQYEMFLKNTANQKQREAFLDGIWPSESGSPFSGVWDLKYNVVDKFKIPKHWHVNISYDWGSAKPFSIGFWAESDGSSYVDSEGKLQNSFAGDLFRIHELYGCIKGERNKGVAWVPKDIAKRVQKIAADNDWIITSGVADSSVFSTQTRPDIVGSFKEIGIYLKPAKNYAGSRIPSLHLMRQMLHNAHNNEKPRLIIFRNCEDFINTVPDLQYATKGEKTSEDIDTNMEDHIYDETRYRIMESHKITIKPQKFGFL